MRVQSLSESQTQIRTVAPIKNVKFHSVLSSTNVTFQHILDIRTPLLQVELWLCRVSFSVSNNSNNSAVIARNITRDAAVWL